MVRGSRGIEFEGAQDRRGIYGGAGAAMGAYFGSGHLFPSPQLQLRIGGGVSKNFTLGARATFAGYFGESGAKDLGLTLGLDIEGQYALPSGFLLRASAGGIGVPKADRADELVMGVGGSIGVGYEFFVDTHAALAVTLDLDSRLTTQTKARIGPLVGFRVTWY